MTKIHPTAIVDASAELDDDVVIGPYCVVGPNVTIGRGTCLHNHVSITGPTTIGRDNIFYPFSVIGADPQDLKFFGEHAVCLIGDRNVIREHVTIHRGTRNGGGVTRVGNDNLLMVSAHIAHDCSVGSHCVIANQVMVAGHVVIEDYVNIGGGVGIHHFVTVHQFAFIGGLTRIKKDIPPFMVIDGDPAEVRGVNVVGLTRRRFSPDEINALKDACKRLFLHRLQNVGAGAGRRNGSALDMLDDEVGNDAPSSHEAARAAGLDLHAGWNSVSGAASAVNGEMPIVTTVAASVRQANGSGNGCHANGNGNGNGKAFLNATGAGSSGAAGTGDMSACGTRAPANAVSNVIGDLVRQYGHLECIRLLCDALVASAEGVHGRSLERRRHDSKYRASRDTAVATAAATAASSNPS